MTHLDEATMVAVRDREDATDAAVRHLETCPDCADAMDEATRRSRTIEDALASLDEPVTDPEAARAAIRARLDRRSLDRAGGRPWWRPAHMGRAAAVLLLAAGAVSALPGSPVRQWIAGPDDVDSTADLAGAPEVQEAEPAGVTVPVPDTGLRVLLSSLGPLAELEVVWIGGAAARLEAPSGSRFTYAEGRVEALVAGGPVRIELPREGPPVSVEVDGAPYVSRAGEEVRVDGPVGERSDTRILFVAP